MTLEDSCAYLDFQKRVIESDFFDIGSFVNANNVGSSLNIQCSQGFLKLSFYREDIISIRINVKNPPAAEDSIAIWGKPEVVKTEYEDFPEKIVFSSSVLKVVIDKDPVRLLIYKDKRLLVSESTLGICHDGHSKIFCYKDMDPKDHFYGFGEKTGFLNKRGQKMEMWNTDVLPHTPDVDRMYQSIPFFITVRSGFAHGIFLDDPGLTTFDLKSSTKYYSFSNNSEQLNYFVFAGPKPKNVLEQYTYLTGRMPLPPKWAIGYHQSRYSYETEKEVREIVDTFKNKDIPLDAVYLDIHYMDGYRVFTFDRNRFPSYRSLISDLKKQGVNVVPIVDPGVKVDADYHVYRDGIKNNVFCRYLDGTLFSGRVWPGESVFPDFTTKRVRNWWKEQNRFYTDSGINGLWNDMNEPAILGQFKPIDMDHNVIHENEGDPKTHKALHNTYGMQMARATHEALLEQNNSRPFVLTRSGYAGIQRYATVWTGDNSSHWEHLQMSLPMCMNLGLSGVAFCGADVGGFMYDTEPELFVRWVEAAAFIPFFRNHSTLGTRNQEPWAFGKDTEKVVQKYIKLRYSFLPHWYNLFYHTSQTGSPLMRPLIFEYPDDPNVVNLNNQFLLGSDILVAPIMQPGITHRSVYLPGGNWYHFFTGKQFSGNHHILAEAPLESLPLFVKGGSFIALTNPKQNTAINDDLLELHYFWVEGNSPSYTIYEDDGLTNQYLEGKYFEAKIEAHCQKDELDFLLKIIHREYQPSWDRLKLVIHGLPEHVTVRFNGREIEVVESSSLIDWDSKVCNFNLELEKD